MSTIGTFGSFARLPRRPLMMMRERSSRAPHFITFDGRMTAVGGAKQTFDETPRARRFPAPWLPAACCAARAFNRCAHTVPSGHRLRAGLFLVDLSILLFWSTVFAAGNDRPAVRTRSHLERFFRIREGDVVAEYLLNPSVVVADVQRLRSSTTSTPQ